MISDDKWDDYQERRETTLAKGGICIDSYEEDGVSKFKFSYGEEAYQKMATDAREQGISVDELIEKDLLKFAPPGSKIQPDTTPLTRQQRRQIERRARKKAR